MARIYDCLGFKAKFVKVKSPGINDHYRRELTYVYLDVIFVGMLTVCPPGYAFFGITDSGSYVTKCDTGIGCLRTFVWDTIYADQEDTAE